jgi:CRISPR-associated protein Cmr2
VLAFWQAKIWGLLHDPALKALHSNTGRGSEGAWQSEGKPLLACMEGWVSPKAKSLTQARFNRQWLKHIGLCDLIASASDRAAIGRLPPTTAINYDSEGLEIRHLLSGAPQHLKLGQWHEFLLNLGNERANWLSQIEASLIPESIRQETDARKVYWWFWRCYPQVLSRALDRDQNTSFEPSLPLLPAETRLPDGSLWSHTTMTSALAGSLAGYHEDADAYPQKGARKGKTYHESRPHVAVFSFTPVQELIKASRKMRDFWAGSWLLHYMSAKVCWAIAWKYGPDTLLYPCLYEQPLIDLWLLQKYPDFAQWLKCPSERQLLTAGFPNVLAMILPDNGASQTNERVKNPVLTAMQQAEQTLTAEWLRLADDVLNDLQSGTSWMPNLNRHTWNDWLKAQWQTYWIALPIGTYQAQLHQSPRQINQYQDWQQQQNEFARPQEHLFVKSEAEFLKAIYESALKEDWRDRHFTTTLYKAKQPNLNVGSWWGNIFDQTRFALNAVKNARAWQLPTAFGPRSTVSGIGPVVHSGSDWTAEGETAFLWSNQAGLFDGIEQLNATEVLKRGLHRILPKVLYPTQPEKHKARLDLFYPDLSSGVAGWLLKHPEANTFYLKVCQEICDRFPWAHQAARQPWGIPKVEHEEWLNPRLLNAAWLIEDFQPLHHNPNQPLTQSQKQKAIEKELGQLREFIGKRFPPGNNPTDWYVLAAGDGDGMSNWLKGEPLKAYSQYIPDALRLKIDRLPEELRTPFKEFLKEKKRMGPATYNALCRALLDFSNRLVPHLTEKRYAGRLIYSGGDDVLAYTNLWEWDSWLWDLRQCFQGAEDPRDEFESQGDYWRWQGEELPSDLPARPLFTMGHLATISFGIVIAHHSVPMALAIENLRSCEDEAKEHQSPTGNKKDAVQIRVLYGNGNILKATAKFDVFNQWRALLNHSQGLESAIFEQAATVWRQHPAPIEDAIAPWTRAFCIRRDVFQSDETAENNFQSYLEVFVHELWKTTPNLSREREIQNWLKLAAFVLRHRDIKFKQHLVCTGTL